LIRSHPTIAFETLRLIPFPWPVADVVHQHHERLDGSGYPLGLKGSQIHPWARIIAVADVLDAMSSHRPYRPCLPISNALDELERGKTTRYDPEAVEIITRVTIQKDSRVMVVDNDPEYMEGMVAELREAGFEGIGFLEPALALHAFARKPFPLVLAELKMAGMDGVQLAMRVKDINPDSEVIIITKHGDKEETLRAMRAGASDFLEKPLNQQIFKKSVTRALQRYAGKTLR
jgi:response regulator RpfG family c-di-GMP phosphodiesterase